MTNDRAISGTRGASRRAPGGRRPLPALLAVLLHSLALPAAGAGDLVLQDALLVDPVSETVRRGTVRIRGERIVEPGEQPADEAATRELDLSGRYLLPGLNDLHVHSYGNAGPDGSAELFGTEGTARRMLYAGVTGFADLSSFEDAILGLRRRQRRGEVPGADLYAAGTAFTCPGGHGTQFPNPARVVDSPAEARRSVAELAAKGPDLVKLIYNPSSERFPSIDRPTLEAIVATAREHGIPTVAHVDAWSDAEEAVAAGVDAITHLDPEPPPQALLERMERRGTAVVPTLAVHTSLATLVDRPERLEDPLRVRLTGRRLREAYRRPSRFPPGIGRWLEAQRELRAGYLRAARSLAGAGVPIALGTDSGNPGTFQGPSVHDELELLVEAGLTPWQALRAATVHAEALLDRDLGGLAPGELANLVVLEASPLEAIANTRRIAYVIHRGRLVDREALLPPGALGEWEAPLTRSAAPPAEAEAQPPVVVAGVVLSPAGQPLSGISVALEGSGLEASTDAAGRFELRGEAGAPNGVLTFGLPGRTARREVDLSEPPAWVELIAELGGFSASLTVAAAAPPAETAPGHRLERLDVYRTPGTRADPLYAAQALPGVIKLDGGAGLYVRGGDVSETSTYLDGALLDHPYRFETPTGGYFSTFSTVQVEGLELSAGGFSARYGDTLSAVLELEGAAPLATAGGSVSVGLDGASFLLSGPAGERVGARLTGGYSDAASLIGLSGGGDEFTREPRSTDLALQVDAENAAGSWRLGALRQTTEVGRELEEGSFSGPLASEGDKGFGYLAWDYTSAGGWSVSSTLSAGSNRELLRLGAIDLDVRDRSARLRVDGTVPAGGWLLRLGGELEATRHRWSGTLPQRGGDPGGLGGVQLWEERLDRRRGGAYVEAERSIGRWRLELGLRGDLHSAPDRGTVDPRLSLAFRPSPPHELRFAWGVYHQAPEAALLSSTVGSPSLDLMAARHLAAGYSFEPEGRWALRAEVYRKDYARLPLERAEGLCGCGRGEATGLDLLLRLDRGESWDGWARYSYLDAERLYTPWQERGRFPPPEEAFPPDFAVPHSAQVVVHRRLPALFTAGVGVRVAAGRPYTPVVAAAEGPEGFLPVYGAINSARLPSYARVDLNLSRSFALGTSTVAVAYLGVDDLLDRDNVTHFAYSADWSRRRPVASGLGRALYVGITLMR